jgi:hypothetical protein
MMIAMAGLLGGMHYCEVDPCRCEAIEIVGSHWIRSTRPRRLTDGEMGLAQTPMGQSASGRNADGMGCSGRVLHGLEISGLE